MTIVGNVAVKLSLIIIKRFTKNCFFVLFSVFISQETVVVVGNILLT